MARRKTYPDRQMQGIKLPREMWYALSNAGEAIGVSRNRLITEILQAWLAENAVRGGILAAGALARSEAGVRA